MHAMAGVQRSIRNCSIIASEIHIPLRGEERGGNQDLLDDFLKPPLKKRIFLDI